MDNIMKRFLSRDTGDQNLLGRAQNNSAYDKKDKLKQLQEELDAFMNDYEQNKFDVKFYKILM